MSSIESSKTLAGVGALLLAFGSFVPIIGIVGIVLLLLGIKGLSDYYKDYNIYKNALMGVVFGVVGLVAITFVVFGVIFGSIFAGLSNITRPDVGSAFFAVGAVIIAVVLLFVFYLLAVLYFRKSFSTLAQRSGEQMFETAGLLLLVGAILTIVLVGLLLVLVAWILVAVAFFSMRTSIQSPVYTSPTAPTPQTVMEYCSNCGAPVKSNDTFCSHCGKPLR